MKYFTIPIIIAAIIGVWLWLRATPNVEAPVTAAAPAAQAKPVAQDVDQKHSTLSSKQTITTKNGMKIETTTEGTGAAIVNGQTALMEYTGMLTDGTVFDATSRHGGEPFSFILGAGQVIKGWDQGVLGMKVGESRRLTIPADLAYGSQGIGGVIPPNATLVFDVTLKGIK